MPMAPGMDLLIAPFGCLPMAPGMSHFIYLFIIVWFICFVYYLFSIHLYTVVVPWGDAGPSAKPFAQRTSQSPRGDSIAMRCRSRPSRHSHIAHTSDESSKQYGPCTGACNHSPKWALKKKPNKKWRNAKSKLKCSGRFRDLQGMGVCGNHRKWL